MGNRYENSEFYSAMQSAGIYGTDWQGNDATDDCSEAFHNEIYGWERDKMSYEEMVAWASVWWSMNSHRYL